MKNATESRSNRTMKPGKSFSSIALLVAISLLLQTSPAVAEFGECGPLQPRTLCEAGEGSICEIKQKVFPCTREDVDRCNSCESENKRLTQLLLEKPPAESPISFQTGLIILGVTAVASFALGGYLGSKL